MPSAGLTHTAKSSRIKRKAVRPPVANFNYEPRPEVQSFEPSEVEKPSEPSEVAPQQEEGASKPKKPGHTQPRFEARLSGDHGKIVEDLVGRAFRESLRANKGINNSELFGGLLEFVRPLRKKITFTGIQFRRGKLYGDGTERIKVEVGKALRAAALEQLVDDIVAGDDACLELLDGLSEQKRRELLRVIETNTAASKSDDRSSSRLAASA